MSAKMKDPNSSNPVEADEGGDAREAAVSVAIAVPLTQVGIGVGSVSLPRAALVPPGDDVGWLVGGRPPGAQAFSLSSTSVSS